jgi:hypothetical protein
VLSPSSSSEEESRRLIAIGDEVGIDIGVEDVDDGIIDVLILGALLGIKIMENKIQI